MGRKRLTKVCTNCKQECERKQFSRSMWEKEEHDPAPTSVFAEVGVSLTFERVCRKCHVEIKNFKERDTFVPAAVTSPSAAAVVVPNRPAALSSVSQSDLAFLMDPFMASPMISSTQVGAGAAVSGTAVTTVPPSPPSPFMLPTAEYDQDADLFEGVDLDNVLGQGEDMKEKRSARAKKRRAKMNSLFNLLAADIGLPVFADRARVLERTREVLRELRDSKKQKLDMSAPAVTVKPVVSIIDVASEHLRSQSEEVVTYSPCA